VHFASGSALTLAQRLTVAVLGLPQKSVGIEAGRQRFGALRFCAPFSFPSTFFAKQKTNIILCLENRRGCDRSVHPKIHTVLSVEESSVDPQAKGRLLDTPLDRVAHAQIVPDPAEINVPPLRQDAVLRTSSARLGSAAVLQT
jgi:hypothetical protein